MTRSPLREVSTLKTRRASRLKSGAVRGVHPLSSKNRKAINMLKTWISLPDDQGAVWWNDFERELAEQRPSFHAI
jgi:chromosomal replication initiation ATPase DnaA